MAMETKPMCCPAQKATYSDGDASDLALGYGTTANSKVPFVNSGSLLNYNYTINRPQQNTESRNSLHHPRMPKPAWPHTRHARAPALALPRSINSCAIWNCITSSLDHLVLLPSQRPEKRSSLPQCRPSFRKTWTKKSKAAIEVQLTTQLPLPLRR